MNIPRRMILLPAFAISIVTLAACGADATKPGSDNTQAPQTTDAMMPHTTDAMTTPTTDAMMPHTTDAMTTPTTGG